MPYFGGKYRPLVRGRSPGRSGGKVRIRRAPQGRGPPRRKGPSSGAALLPIQGVPLDGPRPEARDMLARALLVVVGTAAALAWVAGRIYFALVALGGLS